MAEFANIIIDISHEKLDKAFQYRVPAHLQETLSLGMQVEIPFGNGDRAATGYVVGLSGTPEYDVDKIKEIRGVVQGSIPIESQLIALAGWMRENYGGTIFDIFNRCFAAVDLNRLYSIIHGAKRNISDRV